MDARDRIQAAARSVFAARGFEGARVRDIARVAEVNQAAIHYYYGTKEKLYQTIINAHFSEVARTLSASAADPNDLEAMLSEMALAYERIFCEKREFIPILLREIAIGDARIKEALRSTVSEAGLARRILFLLESGMREGRLRNVDSKQAIVSYIGMNLIYHLLGPIVDVVWEIKDHEKFRRDRPRAVVDLFLNGLNVDSANNEHC